MAVAPKAAGAQGAGCNWSVQGPFLAGRGQSGNRVHIGLFQVEGYVVVMGVTVQLRKKPLPELAEGSTCMGNETLMDGGPASHTPQLL